MEIQNDDVTTLTHGDRQMPQVRPHVWEVPPELGEHLLCFPHHGWRIPDPPPHDWTPPVVVQHVPVVVHPEPEVEVVDVLTLQDVPGDDEGTGGPTEPEAAPQEAPGAADGAPVTITDALVAMARDAGSAGLTSAGAVAVHGRGAYAILGTLVEDGRLVRQGRGRYAHPDFA